MGWVTTVTKRRFSTNKLSYGLLIGTSFYDLESPWTTVTQHLTIYSFYQSLQYKKQIKRGPYYQRQNDSSWSVDFRGVQIVHKFVGWVTPNLDFKVTMFFKVKYLENGIRQTDRKLYVVYRMVPFSMTLNDP